MDQKKTAWNMLVGALEGGSNYWYWLDGENLWNDDRRADEYLESRIIRKLWDEGQSLTVYDKEEWYASEELVELGTMTKESILEAFTLMYDDYPRHYVDLLNQNDDATTADVWFQLAVMKDVVYG